MAKKKAKTELTPTNPKTKKSIQSKKELSVSGLSKSYINDIKQILRNAKAKANVAINYSMVEAYWLIGKRIIEEIQQGEKRANYGEKVIINVSKALTAEFGKGYSDRSVRQYRQFYQMFPKLSIQRSLIAISDKSTKSKANLAISDRQIQDTEIQSPLHWTHIQRIMRVSNPEARTWYLKEAAEQSWDVRTLDRNISTQYYERLLMSQVKKPVIKEMNSKTKKYQANKLEFIKNPSVLEFLGLPGNTGYSEAILEKGWSYIIELLPLKYYSQILIIKIICRV